MSADTKDHDQTRGEEQRFERRGDTSLQQNPWIRTLKSHRGGRVRAFVVLCQSRLPRRSHLDLVSRLG